jgi:hypothetical protein
VALWQAWAVMEAKQGDKSAVRYLFKKALGANPRSRYESTCRCWEAVQKVLLQRGMSENEPPFNWHASAAELLQGQHWQEVHEPYRIRWGRPGSCWECTLWMSSNLACCCGW